MSSAETIRQALVLPTDTRRVALPRLQVALLQQLDAVAAHLPMPIYVQPLRLLLQECVQPIARKLFGIQYPIDVRILTAPSADAPPLVILGVGHLWAVQSSTWQLLARQLPQAFSYIGMPSGNFSAYPAVVRTVFAAAARVWYGGIWEGNALSWPLIANPFLRQVRRHGTHQVHELDPPRPLTPTDHRVAALAVPILGGLLASMAGLLPHWLLLVQFGVAFGSLFLKHGNLLKPLIHPLGDALVHRTARDVTDSIHHTMTTQTLATPPCFVMGNLCYLGVLELLKERGYQELSVQQLRIASNALPQML